MPKRLKFAVEQCCLWYDGKRGRPGDSKISNRPFTFESNRDGRFEFQLNLEALHVPTNTKTKRLQNNQQCVPPA